MDLQSAGVTVQVRPASGPVTTERLWAFSAIGIGTFMTSLDGSGITTILPIIGRSFGAPIATVEWVMTAYLLVVSALLLAVGWLADVRGHERVYVAGVAVFVVGSTLCAAAPSIAMLIGFRAVQATGSAMILAASAPLLLRIYPSSDRGWALGLHVAANYVALAVGPWLSGWLTDWYGWRAAFMIHLPLGLVAGALSVRLPWSAAPLHPRRRFDAAGSVLFGGGLAAFLFAMNQVRNGSISAAGLVLFAAAVAAVLAFAAVESHRENAVLDVRMFTRAPFSISVSSLVFAYLCLQSVTFALPFYLIHIRGLTAVGAGLLMSLRPTVTALVAPLSGRLCDRAGPALIGSTGVGVLCVGCLFAARVDGHSSLAHISSGLTMMALGMGLLLAPAHSALLGAAQVRNQGVAAGMMNTARTVGMALGVGMGRILLLGLY